MIDVLALVFSAVSLICVAVLLRRDARRADDAGMPDVKPKFNLMNRIEALVKRHQHSVEPGHRTSLASVKDIIANAERESAKIRFIK